MRIAQLSLVAGLLALGTVGAVQANDTTTATSKNKPAGADVSWLKDADTSGNAEVASAQLAISKAQRADVRAYAQEMADAHTSANHEIADIATKLGVALPAEKPKEHGLDTVKDADFDAAYLKAQIKEHEGAEKLFEKGVKSKNADIRAFAEKTLPTVRKHLADAKRLAGSAKG